MKNILAMCLCLATFSQTGSNGIATDFSTSTASLLDSSNSSVETTSPTPAFEFDEELAKIANTCLTIREHEQIMGDNLRYMMARTFVTFLIDEAQEVIGLQELRSVLGFAPPGNWTNYKEPTKQEIAAAPTIEEYYELKEPRSRQCSLNSGYFFEKNFPPAIAFWTCDIQPFVACIDSSLKKFVVTMIQKR